MSADTRPLLLLRAGWQCCVLVSRAQGSRGSAHALHLSIACAAPVTSKGTLSTCAARPKLAKTISLWLLPCGVQQKQRSRVD